MFRREHEPRSVNRLYQVDLHGETLNAMEQRGVSIFYYGDRAKVTKYERGLEGTVAVYREGILERSYGEPWRILLEMIAEENAKLQRQNPSWQIIVPPNPATAIAVAHIAYEQYGINVLPFYTRVGEDGSLIARSFYPGGSADVFDHWLPGDRRSFIGVLPLAVKATETRYIIGFQ